MHEITRCANCQKHTFACECTTKEMEKFSNEQYSAMENHMQSDLSHNQMIKILRDAGYKIEKRRPNPKKKKKSRR